MRTTSLIFLVLLLCLTRIVLAQEKAGSNPEDTVRQAQELLELSERQNVKNHALALQTAQRALVLWQAVGDRAGIAKTYAEIARCYLIQSDLVEATKTYEKVLQLWRELNNPKQEASTLISLGYIEFRKGEWSAAISFFTQAQSLLDDRDVFEMGQISLGLANIFSENGLPENALIQLRRALEYFRQTPDERDDKRMILELGNVYYLLGNFTEAVAYLQQALASFAPATLDAAQCHEYLGRVYGSLGESAIALQHLRSAVPIYERIGNPKEAAQARGLMGQIYHQLGRLELARQYYQRALVTFRALSDQVNQSAIHYALGRLELKSGNYDAAENYLRQSIDETENLRRVSTSRDLTAAFSATVHERYASYIECLMHKHQAQPSEGFDVIAFEMSELARARSLAELLRATQTNLVTGLDPQLAEREKSLRQSLRVKEDAKVKLLSAAYTREELSRLDTEMAKLEAEYKEVNGAISARFPAYDRTAQPTKLTLQQIQAQVLTDDNTLLLEYALGTNKSYMWAITRTGASSYELPGRAQIEHAAQELYASLIARQPRADDTPAQLQARVHNAETKLPSQIAALSNILLGPIADKLQHQRLLIVADGPLQYIPFQALTRPTREVTPDEWRPLMMDHEIVNEPSASTLALVLSESASRKAPSRSVAILADPVFEVDDSRLKSANTGAVVATRQPLPGEVTRAFRDVGVEGGQIPRLLASREEAEAIMLTVPWRTGFKAVDFQANRTTAIGTDLGQYRVVHFATHALLNNDHPELSGIVLSLVDQKGQPQNGYLRLQDIYNLKLPVDLVVLSACQTGLGKDVKGEGLIGLTRGFLYAGASGVIASLWKVDDDATAELMKHFYAGLFEKGLSPSAALREAQIALQQQKRWREPYYWAGFVIQGQYAARVHHSYQPTLAVKLAALVVLGGIVLAMAFFAIRRRRSRVL